MQHEHEEAMRADFTEHTRLHTSMFTGDKSDAEIDRIEEQTRTISDRWSNGPHAQHWAFLNDAYADWRDAPDTMTRFLGDLDDTRAQGWDGGYSEVQHRSLYQARDLAAPPRPQREPIQRER